MKTKHLVGLVSIVGVILVSVYIYATWDNIESTEELSVQDFNNINSIEALKEYTGDSLASVSFLEASEHKKMSRVQFKKYWTFLLTGLAKNKADSEEKVKMIKSELKDSTVRLSKLKDLYQQAQQANNDYISIVENYMSVSYAERLGIDQFGDTLNYAKNRYNEFVAEVESVKTSKTTAHFIMTSYRPTAVNSELATKQTVELVVIVVLRVADFVIDKVNKINEEKRKRLIEAIDKNKWGAWEDVR